MATEAFDDLVETFTFLEDWEDRYRFIIDLGKELPEMDEVLKTSSTKVEGCASQVWLHTSWADGQFNFVGDSDAMIVKGLIAVLHKLYAGLTPTEILEIDAIKELDKLDLRAHLSAQRSNGVRAMIERIRSVAQSS